jgi:para-nitrobenzyl esterase
MEITRRGLIGAAAPILLLPGRTLAAAGNVIAETEGGKIRGSVVGGVRIYRGVPYAGSVSGTNRFKPAKPVKPWPGVRDASLPGAPSIQPPGGTFGNDEPAPAEDCLNLTVWTPANDGNRRPVMFYSHGGGFSSGSSASVLQDGANLARLYDVVVVATNHRLGLLGYLYLDGIAGTDYAGSGNCGMLDIIAGLGWVSRNIDRFGGDPSNVMIFGESGGGAKTSCLYAMPGAAPHFNKASIESGPGIRMTEADEAARMTESVLSELGIGTRDWRRVLDVPAAKLLELQLKLSGMPNDATAGGGNPGGGLPAMRFSPVVDGKALPAHPFDPAAPAISRNKPLIVGYNRDEAAFFAFMSGDVAMFNVDETGLRQRLKPLFKDYEQVIATYRRSRPAASPADILIAVQSARFAGNGSITIAERKAVEQSAPAFAYIFDYPLETTMPGANRPLGPMHALEIPFKFNNVDAKIHGSVLAGKRSERYVTGHAMSEMWATFARTGTPGAVGQPHWPAYTLDRRQTMIIDAACQVEDDPYGEERLFWQTRVNA